MVIRLLAISTLCSATPTTPPRNSTATDRPAAVKHRAVEPRASSPSSVSGLRSAPDPTGNPASLDDWLQPPIDACRNRKEVPHSWRCRSTSRNEPKRCRQAVTLQATAATMHDARQQAATVAESIASCNVWFTHLSLRVLPPDRREC